MRRGRGGKGKDTHTSKCSFILVRSSLTVSGLSPWCSLDDMVSFVNVLAISYIFISVTPSSKFAKLKSCCFPSNRRLQIRFVVQGNFQVQDGFAKKVAICKIKG